METERNNPSATRKRAQFGCFAAVLVLSIATVDPAWAQQSSGIIAVGNAAVTGFSGAPLPTQIAPGEDPADKTFIDLDGASLRIIDLQHMDGPPIAQLVDAPKPTTWFAAQIGQVFGVAIDNANPPNIYAAATSAYGLPIVAPGPADASVHLRNGAPNAAFMPGLWGGAGGGGPGSIWKIDGTSGAVSLFVNVKLDSRANSGAALSGLAFDPASNSLYAADRETGFIHRFALNGAERDRYDHGTTGRKAQGLAPVAFDPSRSLDITNAKFDSADPSTWNYAAAERRIFGLAVYKHRLYYAVAYGLQIWSVGLRSDGSFGKDATPEVAVPPGEGPSEISKIAFDEEGRMLLAERPSPTGARDFEALTQQGIGRVLRYAISGADADMRSWQSQPAEYAIGFQLRYRNGNGGVDIGYRYDSNGDIDFGTCGGFLWLSGEQLRKSADAALAKRLKQSGPENVDGLQGNATWRIRGGDNPPLASYFIDYDDRFDDDAARGHMGDIAISRPCTPVQRAGGFGTPQPAGGPPGGNIPPGGRTPPPPPPPTPPSNCPPGQNPPVRGGSPCLCARPSVMIGNKCCSPQDLQPGGACASSSCGPGTTPIGPSNFCCNNNQVYAGAGGQACCSAPLVNGQCSSGNKPGGCQPGYVPIGGSCCLASQMTSTGLCCPTGQAPSGPNKSQCQNLIPIKTGPSQCCHAGFIPASDGSCCAVANVTSKGVCCDVPITDPNNRANCPAKIQSITKCADGYTKMPNGLCCKDNLVSDDGKTCKSGSPPALTPPSSCPPGQKRDSDGDCVVVRPGRGACPPGQGRDSDGDCVPIRLRGGACAPGQFRTERGECVSRGPVGCPPGMVRGRGGECVRIGPPGRIYPGRPRFFR
jgi:hypothetical protein